MIDPDELFALGPQAAHKTRRMSDPGPNKTAVVASRHKSEPGRGFSVFSLRTTESPEPLTMAARSKRSGNANGNGHHPYADTSSASQSFMSLDEDNALADTDTPTRSAVGLGTPRRDTFGGEGVWRNSTLRRPDTQQSTNSGSDRWRDTLRPGTQQSMNSSSEGAGQRLSYAETSSATQSFVSFDSGPVDTPTGSNAALSNYSDVEAGPVPGAARGRGGAMRQASRSPARNMTGRAAPQTQPALPTSRPDPRQAQAVRQPTRQAPGESDYYDRTVRAGGEAVDAAPLPNPWGGQAQSSAASARQPTRSFSSQTSGRPDATGSRPGRRSADQDQPQAPSPRQGQAQGTVPGQWPDPYATAHPGQRREAAAGAATSHPSAPSNASTQAPTAPSESDPRRTFKVSETPTVVPSKPPAFHSDQTPIQESRPQVPSAASNRSGAPTAPSASPSKPTPYSRQEAEPRSSTSARPSMSSSRPTAPSSSPAKPRPPPESPVPEKPAKKVAETAISTPRPPLPPGGSQMDTKYVNMLLAVDSIPPLFNLLASFFTWILLAGFVLFPGTFTNLQQDNEFGALAVNVVRHVSLYVIAWVCTGIGAAGMCWLWYRWRGNYIWLVNRIFMPGFLNSLAGVLSTLSSVLGTQSATLSISSTSTIIVTSSVAGVCGILTAFYMLVLIRRLKKQHDAEVGKQRSGKHGEGFTDTSKRKNTKSV